MSYEKPLLSGGNPSNQGIFEVVETARHVLGTRAFLEDGRVFYYACNRGSALTAGHLLSAAAISGDFDDLATNTALVGDTSVEVTPVGSATYAENQLAGGWLSINSGTTGAGLQYKIKSHPATSAASAFDVELWDSIQVAFNADTTATVVPNPYSSVAQADVSADLVPAGVAPVAVGSGSTDPQYFWCQTWGVATALADVASDIVGHAITKGSTADGSFIGFVDAAADVDAIIGVNMFTTVDDDFMPIILQIMP